MTIDLCVIRNIINRCLERVIQPWPSTSSCTRGNNNLSPNQCWFGIIFLDINMMSIMRFHILNPSRVWVSDNVVVLPLGSTYHTTTLHAKVKASSFHVYTFSLYTAHATHWEIKTQWKDITHDVLDNIYMMTNGQIHTWPHQTYVKFLNQ